MNPSPQNLATEYALLALLAGLWGSSYLLIKLALATIPPVTLIAIRVSIAALFLLAIMQMRGERLPQHTKDWRALFVQSLLNSSIAWLVLAWGQQYVPSGTAGVLNSTSPLFVLLIGMVAALWSRWRNATGAGAAASTSRKTIGVALGLVGVVLVIGVDALAGLGQQTLAQAMGNARVCLVFGSEGEGMRQNTEAHCDDLARLPISPKVESLNISNAAAIGLYAAATRHSGGTA